jgi:phosphoribosylamine--glycine ligase
MKILIIGSGGREHALAWKAAQSERVEQVFVAPGNAGTAAEPKVSNVPIVPQDFQSLCAFAKDKGVLLTIVGPEIPLVEGLVDIFASAGLRCLGPSREAARLEGSKSFCKDFLARHGIATADYREFTDLEAALKYLDGQALPIVIKADGLAGGKGVVVAWEREEALTAVQRMLSGEAFGEAGRRVVIEEYLEGEEASFIALVDGEHVLPLASSQDHKARDDGDGGPNTGGMGAYSPAPVVSEELHERILREIMVPTVRGMAEEGRPYSGFLYAGLMIARDGTPRVLEYNCRLGDPETQPILLRLCSDLPTLCEATLEGTLHQAEARWDPQVALGVVLTAAGYPGKCREGDVIAGLAAETPDTKVFHAGTRQVGEQVLTAGGRVLCVCGRGKTVHAARRVTYERVEGIHWEGMHYRKDIGYRALAREGMFSSFT